jgi:hypothetical protein
MFNANRSSVNIVIDVNAIGGVSSFPRRNVKAKNEITVTSNGIL